MCNYTGILILVKIIKKKKICTTIIIYRKIKLKEPSEQNQGKKSNWVPKN